jgi:hypothetical protein
MKEGYWELAAGGDRPKDVMRAKVQVVEKQQAEIRQELDTLADENRRLEDLEDLENMTFWLSSGPTGIHLAYIDYDTGGPSDGPYSFRNLLQKMGPKIVKHENGKLEVNDHWMLRSPRGARSPATDAYSAKIGQGLYLRSGNAPVDLPYESTRKGVKNGQFQSRSSSW